jgi:hypothetical protein
MRHNARAILAIIALAIICAVQLHAKDKPAPVTVYVVQPQASADFVDDAMKQRIDSTNDVLKSLRRIEGTQEIRLVNSPDEAATVLEVLDRGYVDNGNRRVTVSPLTRQLGSTAESDIIIHVQLTVGSYSTVFTGVASGSGDFAFPTYTAAASSACGQFRRWIKANREKLESR